MNPLKSGITWAYAVSQITSITYIIAVSRELFSTEEMIRLYLVMYGIISVISTPYSDN